jgi:hypothetical protein
MSDNPNFERAVGIKEEVFQCLEKACKGFFRASANTTQCPHCNGSRIKNVRSSALPGTGAK